MGLSMDILIPIIAAALAAGIVMIVMRSATARQLAEARAAAAVELAASQQALLDKADLRIRETFQSLASQALTTIASLLRPREDHSKRIDNRSPTRSSVWTSGSAMFSASVSIGTPVSPNNCRARIVSDDAGKCTSNAGRPRPLGRAAAPACRRVGGHAATLRF